MLDQFLADLRSQKIVRFNFTFANAVIRATNRAVIGAAMKDSKLEHLTEAALQFTDAAITNLTFRNLRQLFEASGGLSDEVQKRLLEAIPSGDENLMADEIKRLKDAGRQIQMQILLTTRDVQIAVLASFADAQLEDDKLLVDKARQLVLPDSENAATSVYLMAHAAAANLGFEAQMMANDNLTKHFLRIPRDLKLPAQVLEIEKQIAEAVEGIPVFPETVQKLITLCEDPDAGLSEIAGVVEKDPGLVSDILKLANSAGYITLKKTQTIYSAVNVLGARTIKQIAVASASRRILNTKFSQLAGYWDRAMRAAFYARRISESLPALRKESDSAYVGGLLHELGKIVLNSMNPQKYERIYRSRIARGSGPASEILENLAFGRHHGYVGAAVARHWGFPDNLVQMIEHNQSPMAADEAHRPLVAVVNIAHSMVMATDGPLVLNIEAMNLLNISSRDTVVEWIKTFSAEFRQNESH